MKVFLKICRRCNITKKANQFFVSAQNKDGLGAYCRQCCREYAMERSRKNGVKPKQRRPPDFLPDEKVCTKCLIKKPKCDFRVRINKKSYYFRYLNPTCRKCDALEAKENYKKKRQIFEGRKKNRELSKKYYQKRRDKALQHMRNNRKTEDYKKKMREYRKKNKAKIYDQEVITKLRYHTKNRDAITDRYCISQIRSQTGIKPENITPEMIDLKRTKILLYRLKNKIKQITLQHLVNPEKKIICKTCHDEKGQNCFFVRKVDISGKLYFYHECIECCRIRAKRNLLKRKKQ